MTKVCVVEIDDDYIVCVRMPVDAPHDLIAGYVLAYALRCGAKLKDILEQANSSTPELVEFVVEEASGPDQVRDA